MEELVHRGRKKINGNSTINVKYYLLSRNFSFSCSIFFMLIVHPIKHCVTFVYVWNNDKNANKA